MAATLRPSPMAKISAEDAFDIFVSDLPPKVLAHRFGLCEGHISKIRHRTKVHLAATSYCVPELLSGFLISSACGVTS